MELSFELWRTLIPAERESMAKRLSVKLPTGFAFDTIVGENAYFKFEEAKFVLVPARECNLGFDADGGWIPTLQETESWRWTCQEYGFSESIHERLAAITLRPRAVRLAPFLIETSAKELGWEKINPEDDEIKSLIKKYPKGVQHNSGDVTIRVRKDCKGVVEAERSLKQTHAELVAELNDSGFRFPTSDEWEYACGGGEPTLFRWGDHAPCDRYPTDVSPAEAEYRKQWVRSGGKLKPPPEGFVRDWDLHVKANRLGIYIASNPYQMELVAEVGTTRGGDGGCTICGGMGFFAGWLAIATAYFEECFCRHDPAEPISSGYTFGRRVLDLG